MVKDLERLFDRLWPLNRSLTGEGVRQTFSILNEYMDLTIYEEPTGNKVFDWTIPPEWKVNEAYIVTPNGKRIAEFNKNNLHLLGYSIPYEGIVTFTELKKHLYTLPEQPDAIPYITSYFSKRWGFCLAYNEFKTLPDSGHYKVLIDSSLSNGSLTYADAILRGKSKKEIIFTSYVCHPSLANNELSGIIVLSFLYNKIKSLKNKKYTYRFILTPETIGTITYLSKNYKVLQENTVAGFVITCVGDDGPYTYKNSKRENDYTNKITKHILRFHAKSNYKEIPFTPTGSDERQYCSPGIDLPVGSLMKTMYSEYPEYHTSLDNKDYISFEAMQQTIEMYFNIVKAIELDGFYLNLQPYCEPQLGKRGLYPSLGTKNEKSTSLLKMLYLLNYSDGEHSAMEIAEKLNCSILDLKDAINILKVNKLLK